MRTANPMARHGTRGAIAGRLAKSAMGIHLPAKVHDGRCRVRAAAAEGLVSVVGRRPQVEVLEDGGEVAFEAGVGGHATCPPGTGAGAGSGSAMVERRIAARA